jgi:hypothetical protein
MSYSFSTFQGKALSVNIPLAFAVNGHTLSIEFDDRGAFSSVNLTKNLTAANGSRSVLVNLSATEVDQIKQCHYRIKAVKAAVTSIIADGTVDYIPSAPSSSSAGYVTLVTARGQADSAAIVAAFNSMKVNGHATGTLVIKGNAFIDTAIDLDGGFLDTENPNNWSAAGSPRFKLVAESLTVATAVANAIRLHGFYGLNLDVAVRGGGSSTSNAIDVYNLHQPDLSIEAINFAGTALHADTYVGSTLDVTRRIRGGKVTKLHVSNCGRTLYWRGIEAFGSFEHVWDNNCVNGSYIGFCADMELTHYESYSPNSQTVGLTLEGCNNFNGGVITLGDRASDCLLKVVGNTADPTGAVFSSDLGSINRIRATCFQPSGVTSYNGVKFVDVHSAVIDNISTAKSLVGVRITGSNVFIKKHHSYTGDSTALIVEGDAYNAAPIVEVGAHYRVTAGTPITLASSLAGGVVKVNGHIESNIFSAGGASSGYAITSASTGVLDLLGLTVDSPGSLAGITNHTGTIRNSNVVGGALVVGKTQVVVSNTTTATTVAGPYTIPAGSVAAGTAYRIKASGTVDNDASATVTLR